MREPYHVPDSTPALGSVVAGKYRLEEVLGKGGMGVVVRALHIQLGEPVALKFLHGQMAHDPDSVERFLREARAAVRIKSEHVARVFDVGTLDGGAPYMVMELLIGDDLHRVGRERGSLSINDAIEYVMQASRALAEAHHYGIVHRDLKPANLFLTHRADGTPLVKVLDFGISKMIDGADQNLTATGDVLGSPLYMSPEQIRDARKVDPRSDIWALGNILYRLLSGRAPFAADTSAATLARIVADPTPLLREERADVPPELEAIVSKCMEKRPEHRFQRVEELGVALSGLQARLATGTLPAVDPRARGMSPSLPQGPVSARLAPRGTVRIDVAVAADPPPPSAASPRSGGTWKHASTVALPQTIESVTETTAGGSAIPSQSTRSGRAPRLAVPVVIAVAVAIGALGAFALVRTMGSRGSRDAPSGVDGAATANVAAPPATALASAAGVSADSASVSSAPAAPSASAAAGSATPSASAPAAPALRALPAVAASSRVVHPPAAPAHKSDDAYNQRQ